MSSLGGTSDRPKRALFPGWIKQLTHNRWVPAVLAVVALKDGKSATAEDIITHCRSLIANYKCPRQVEFRDALPLSGAGKIMKNVLREPFWRGKSKSVN